MTSSTHSYRDVLLIFGYVAAVLLFAAIFSPPVFWGMQKIYAAYPGSWVDELLGHRAFPAYFNRVALLGALLGLWPLFKAMHMTRAEVLGSQPHLYRLQFLSSGFLLAAGLLFIMGMSYLYAGAYKWKSEPRWTDILSPMTSAWVVAFLEEFLFRGAVLGMLCRSLGSRAGLFWGTTFFAAVHFLKPPEDSAILNSDVVWSSGFWVITQLFQGFYHVENLLEEFLTLAAVGFVLGWVKIRTGSLWGCVGLHAGWVFGLKYFGGLKNNTRSLKEGDWYPWIGENLKIGVTSFLVVILTGAVMLYLNRRRLLKK